MEVIKGTPFTITCVLSNLLSSFVFMFNKLASAKNTGL